MIHDYQEKDLQLFCKSLHLSTTKGNRSPEEKGVNETKTLKVLVSYDRLRRKRKT